MFTARYGLIPYIKQIAFRLQKVCCFATHRCMLWGTMRKVLVQCVGKTCSLLKVSSTLKVLTAGMVIHSLDARHVCVS